MTDNSEGERPVTDAVLTITLPAEPTSASAARRFVTEQLRDAHEEVVEAAALLTTELATNAILHAATAFAVKVTTDDDRIRIELTDESPVMPVRRRFSTDAGTGRGLRLVEALSLRWGVEPGDPGKTVFFEVDTTPGAAAPPVEFELDPGEWPDLSDIPPAPAPGLTQVCIVDLPLALEHRSSEHYAEMFREFALIAEREPELRGQVPGRLLGLVDELTGQFSGFTSQPQAELTAAHERGDEKVDLEYWVPAEVGAAAARLDDLLDEAEEFCRSGGALLTLAGPPDVLRYRKWYLAEFVDQCAGRNPTPWPGSPA